MWKLNTQFYSYTVLFPEYVCSLGTIQFAPQTTQTASTSHVVDSTPTAGSDASTPEISDVGIGSSNKMSVPKREFLQVLF